ncbi:hypothetical protein [Chamaesiphon sp. OTE_8_metabat_110]|uniref:hypothetical protein n=1 Tax=Chamaesiphon sp. OTE_8_metabat_110 TaxID=2964696 RepID=UPI00286CACF0|nr:hypothetical protein [Chamaesiphon sp. OTE_8_metabat_110]
MKLPIDPHFTPPQIDRLLLAKKLNNPRSLAGRGVLAIDLGSFGDRTFSNKSAAWP